MRNKFRQIDRRAFVMSAASALGVTGGSQWALTNYGVVSCESEDLCVFSVIDRDTRRGKDRYFQVDPNGFQPGEKVVIRAIVFDSITGQQLNSPEQIKARGLSVEIQFDGESKPFPMIHGIHDHKTASQSLNHSKEYILPQEAVSAFGYTISAEDRNGAIGTVQFVANSCSGNNNSSES